MPRISILMASFNHERFVAEAIQSVLDQSLQDFELIVTDDGSSDRTVEVVRRFDDPRIDFVALQKNQGACVAMNACLARAKGEFLATLNSDDAFLPYKLERQLSFLESAPHIGAVFGRPRFMDEASRDFAAPPPAFKDVFSVFNQSRAEWLRYFFERGNCLCHPTVLVRKSCYDRIGPFDPLLMQLPDFDQWVRLCSHFEIHILDEDLLRFRVLDREMNTSAPSPARMARQAWELTSILSHFANLPPDVLRIVVGNHEAWRRTEDPVVALAIACLATGRPGYVQFGADLLRECLRQSPRKLPYRDYFDLIAKADPCGAQFEGEFFRRLSTSRSVGAVRGAIRSLRSRGR
jgi:glycosyltransferase involved in cell wall biosynthesis